MYDHDETVRAIRDFYRLLVSLAYPDESALKEPPAEGWSCLNMDRLRALGKNDAVIALLRHLPCLSPIDCSDRLLIHSETLPIDYTDSKGLDGFDWGWDAAHPLPSHCVYLFHSIDAVGLNLILDTDRGTMTEYYQQGGGKDANVSWEAYEAIPEPERWRAHVTTPIVDFFATWYARHAKLVWMLVPASFFGPTSGRFVAPRNG